VDWDKSVVAVQQKCFCQIDRTEFTENTNWRSHINAALALAVYYHGETVQPVVEEVFHDVGQTFTGNTP
jgi:hypothetical protein